MKIVNKDFNPAIRFYNEKTDTERTWNVLFHIKEDSNELSMI